jgi:hypothetical protein
VCEFEVSSGAGSQKAVVNRCWLKVSHVLVLPAAVATAQATLLAGRSCGKQAESPKRPEREAQLETHALATNPSQGR